MWKHLAQALCFENGSDTWALGQASSQAHGPGRALPRSHTGTVPFSSQSISESMPDTQEPDLHITPRRWDADSSLGLV